MTIADAPAQRVEEIVHGRRAYGPEVSAAAEERGAILGSRVRFVPDDCPALMATMDRVPDANRDALRPREVVPPRTWARLERGACPLCALEFDDRARFRDHLAQVHDLHDDEGRESDFVPPLLPPVAPVLRRARPVSTHTARVPVAPSPARATAAAVAAPPGQRARPVAAPAATPPRAHRRARRRVPALVVVLALVAAGVAAAIAATADDDRTETATSGAPDAQGSVDDATAVSPPARQRQGVRADASGTEVLGTTTERRRAASTSGRAVGGTAVSTGTTAGRGGDTSTTGGGSSVGTSPTTGAPGGSAAPGFEAPKATDAQVERCTRGDDSTTVTYTWTFSGGSGWRPLAAYDDLGGGRYRHTVVVPRGRDTAITTVGVLDADGVRHDVRLRPALTATCS